MSERSKYGLFVIKKSAAASTKLVNSINQVFQEVNETEDNGETKMGQSRRPMTNKSVFLKSQVQTNIEKALEEDSDIFEYDAVYETMKADRQDSEAKIQNKETNNTKQAKYIGSLLQAAEHRKREQERRKEKAIQKERLKESDEYTEKESFVTDAYQKKLLIMKQDEELEQKKKAHEEQHDVTKQSDLSLFYRSMLNSTNSKPSEEILHEIDSVQPRKESSASGLAEGAVALMSSKTDVSSSINVKSYYNQEPTTIRPRSSKNVSSCECPERNAEEVKNLCKIDTKNADMSLITNNKMFEVSDSKNEEIFSKSNENDSTVAINRGSTDPISSIKKMHDTTSSSFETPRKRTKFGKAGDSESKGKAKLEYMPASRNQDESTFVGLSGRTDHETKHFPSESKFSKRTIGETLETAREKYLARKRMSQSKILSNKNIDDK